MRSALVGFGDGLGRQWSVGEQRLDRPGVPTGDWSHFLVAMLLALAPAGCSSCKGPASGVNAGPGATLPAAAVLATGLPAPARPRCWGPAR